MPSTPRRPTSSCCPPSAAGPWPAWTRAILLDPYRQVRSLAFLVPVALYVVYTLRVLPGLRVFKHAFRGLSHARVGRHRRALQAFRRALQLDPNYKLAREGFWDVHRSL